MTDWNSGNDAVSRSPSPSSDDDGASDTSTLVYSQQAFETYQHCVEEIVQKTWPGLEKEQIAVERMHGGSYNRITGISFNAPESKRFPDLTTLTDHLAPLRFVYQYPELPVPKVVAFDCSSDNALTKPYIIQERAPGRPVLHEYPAMSHQSRLAAARQLGRFYNNITTINGNRIGKLVPAQAELLDDSWSFNIQTFITTIFETIPLKTEPYHKQTQAKAAFQGLLEIFQFRLNRDLADPYDFRAPYDRSFLSMTEDLYRLGCFEDTPLTLCHLDLEVYNILVDISNETAPISAVLDWDDAVFASVFVACTPPMWLWGWRDGEDEDERQANETPATVENQQLKQSFEDAAGATYMRFAYKPECRLARRLFRFALSGIHSAEQQEEADQMLKEWSEIKPKST